MIKMRQGIETISDDQAILGENEIEFLKNSKLKSLKFEVQWEN